MDSGDPCELLPEFLDPSFPGSFGSFFRYIVQIRADLCRFVQCDAVCSVAFVLSDHAPWIAEAAASNHIVCTPSMHS